MSTITVDINDFSRPNFDAKSWINSVLKPTIRNSEEDDGGAKDTTVLVTKLQMVSETASRQFDQLSTSVIKSMPRIMYDLKVIAENAKSTHQGVEAVKKNLGLIEGDTEAALEQLRRPHVAKTRMEECQLILQEKSDELEQQRKEKEALEELTRKNEEEEEEEEKRRKATLSPPAPLIPEPEPEVIETQPEEKPEKEVEVKKELPVEEKPVFDEGLEYGHVQLPPLRSAPPPRRVQTPVLNNVPEDENNSYLQQIQDSMTPQVSNVFKRIGVPVSFSRKIVMYQIS
jgi:hypothetical protein